MTGKHSVYVVELDPVVMESKKFREANPNSNPSMPCVYVGMTGLTPEQRFANHKAGRKANRYVQRYGLHPLPDLYAQLNPLTFDEAEAMEQKLAAQLRAMGYAVWQA